MKKIVLSAILLIFMGTLYAQEGTMNMGFNFSFAEPIEYYRPNNSTEKLSKNVTNGFKAGFIYETNIIKGFGVSMSLNYAFSANIGSYQITPGIAALKTKTDHTYHFLEVPVDWQYKFLIAKQTYLGIYTGPTLQVGLSNKYRHLTKLNDKVIEDTNVDVYKIDSDNDNIPDYNRVNVTWGVGAVFQYKRYFIRGGYDFGVMSIYKDPFHNTSSDSGWNRKGRLDQWQIKLGFYLWELK